MQKHSNIMRAVVLGALVVFLGCAGPSYKLNLKPYELTGMDYPFPSGLRVFVQPDHSSPVVMVHSMVDAPASAEPKGKEGMAHLVEHLCFRAVHGKNPPVMTQVRQMGGRFNATTSMDRTNYYTLAPKDSLNALLKIEALRMINPLENVTKAHLKIEREVVRNELRLRVENGQGGYLWHNLNAMLWPDGHPYAQTVIGTHDSLSSITMKDINKWVEDHYVPKKWTLVIVGDVTPEEAKKAISSTIPKKLIMGDAKTLELVEHQPRVKQEAAPAPPNPVTQEMRKIKGPVTEPNLVLGWSLPAGYRGSDPLLRITGLAMTQAVGYALDRDWDPRRRGEVKGLNCFAMPGRHGTTAMCFIALVEGQDPEKIRKRAIDGLVEMWRSDNEATQRQVFHIAKAQWMADEFTATGSIMRRGDMIGDSLHFTGNPNVFSENMMQLSKINHFDMRNLAYKYLTRDRVVTLLIEPFGDEEQEKVAFDESALWAGATLSDESSANLGVFRKMNPKAVEAVAMMPDMSVVKDVTLDNGLRVIAKQHGGAPFVYISLQTRGGVGTVEPFGLHRFMRTNHRATRDPLQIASDWWGEGYDQDSGSYGVSGPSGNVHALLDLLSDKVTTLRIEHNTQAVKRSLVWAERQRKTVEKRPDVWAQRAMWRLLLGEHPLVEGAKNEYDSKAIRGLSSADYKKVLHDQLAPKNATLFIVGDIDPDKVIQYATMEFGKWRADDPGTAQPLLPTMGPTPQRQIAFVDVADKTQTNVSVGCHMQPVKNDAAVDVLSKYMREELYETIRERFGASYGVGAFPARWPGGTELFVVSGAIQNDKSVASLELILKRLKQIQKGDIDKGKLMKAKWNVARDTITSNGDAREMLFTMSELVHWEKPLATLDSYPEQLANVTKRDLQNLLQKCVGHEVITVVGPNKQIGRPLARLKIPTEPVDWRAGSDAKATVKTDIDGGGTE